MMSIRCKEEVRQMKKFANEAKFEEAYEKFLAKLPQAGRVITDRHAEMASSFMRYLDAFERMIFRHVYESGYAESMSRARGVDKEDALGRSMRDIHCPSRKKYQVTSNFGHYLYENEHDAIKAVVMLAPYHGMEILEGEVKAELDIHGCYDACPLVVQKCDF